MTLSSTKLSEDAQDQLVDALATDNLFCWSPVACAVLAVDDLLGARDNEPKWRLACTVWVAISVWFFETDHLSPNERKIKWNKTVFQLMVAKPPLLRRSFNSDVRRVLTDVAAVAFDKEVERVGGPGEGYIAVAFRAIRSYTVRAL